MNSLTEQFTIEKIAVPILVAVITTLLVEYFAKPKLEARKARLLRDRQQFDRIIFCFQRASASIGALPNDEQIKSGKVFQKFASIMLEDARTALYELLKEMSQLSSIYVANHREHVAKTTKFVGYLLARVEIMVERDRNASIAELQDLASNLELFDVYFLVYVYMYDSQESSVKRMFWRIFSRNDNRMKIDQAFNKYGISPVDLKDRK